MSDELTEQEVVERAAALRRVANDQSIFGTMLQNLKANLGAYSAEELLQEARRQLLQERPAPPRPRGRLRWTREQSWQRYRDGRAALGTYATDEELATWWGYHDVRPLRALIHRFGRPPE